MDLNPRALSRWLPWLGGVLALQAFLGASLEFRTRGSARTFSFWDLVGIPIFPGMFVMGVVAVRTSRRTLASNSLFGLSLSAGVLLALRTTLLPILSRMWSDMFYSDAFLQTYLPMITGILTVLAVPALWGSALALMGVPEGVRIRRVARLSAGLLSAGILVKGLSTACVSRMGMMEGSVNIQLEIRRAFLWGGLSTLFLIWACVEQLRPVHSASDIASAARRTHWAMLGWLLSLIALWFYSIYYGTLNEANRLPRVVLEALFQYSIFLSLTLFTTVTLALSLRAMGTPDSQPPVPHPL